MYEYPKKLIDFLTEQDAEGAEIFTTHIVDGTMWIINPKELDNWLLLVTWYDGDSKFDMVNLCGEAYHRLSKVMAEEN